MLFSKDHNRGKEKHSAGEHGLSLAIQNWKKAVSDSDKSPDKKQEERAKYAFAIRAYLGERGRKLDELVENGTLSADEVNMIRADSQKAQQ